jgi:hypothetical protein
MVWSCSLAESFDFVIMICKIDKVYILIGLRAGKEHLKKKKSIAADHVKVCEASLVLVVPFASSCSLN